MSYILEALKKAQAERARGAVPGVDAQPVPTIEPRMPMSPWAGAAGLLLVLSIGAGMAWRVGWGKVEIDTPAPAPRPAAVVVSPPPAPVASVPPAAVPASRPTASAAVIAPVPPQRKLGEPAPGDVAAVKPVPVVTPAPPQVALLQDLPAQIQREIPPLAINGYIYASNAADRSVLINNRLRREGDTIADGFVLEKLLPREMVLNYRGYRYRVSY